jgi:hypothetical protein
MPYLGVGYDVWYTPKKINKGMYGSQARRRSLYAQRGAAARRIQTGYRRYRRSAGNTDQRQLTSVLRSYRKANPYQITPSAGKTVTFWRKTEINFQLGQTTGFQGGGKNINFGFSLGRVFGWVDGVFTISSVTPNFSEFQALFDYYKINAVKMQVFFTKTTSDLGSTSNSSLGMPMLLIANDFDDIQETMTLFSMMERVGCRHVQFDASSQRGICHYVKPKPSNTVVQTDITTGLTSTSPAGVVFGTQWLDCATSNIVHSGIKVYYDNQGLTTATVLGNISFVFDVCFEFKGYR